MRKCPICRSPKGLELTKKVLSGEITIDEAAKQMNVPYHVFWNHIKHINLQTKEPLPDNVSSSDLLEMIRNLVLRLHELVSESILSGNVSPSLIRELRGLIKDLVDLSGVVGIQQSSGVSREWIDQFIAFILRTVDKETRSKIAEWLEQHPVEAK